MAPITFSTAEALRAAKLHLCTDGNPTREGQACVLFRAEGQPFEGLKSQTIPISRGLGSSTLQISWPRDKPQTMIDTLGVPRSLENLMVTFWERGEKAADDLKLVGRADVPYEVTKEVYYSLEEVTSDALVKKRFPSHIAMLASRGFPVHTQKIYEAVEFLLEGEPLDSPAWLHDHVAQEHLLRIENADLAYEEKYLPVLRKYQALIFGFYYQLLKQILSFELVEPTAFFHGIWGAQSTTFLAMCTQLCGCLRPSSKASRAHIIYMLASMYNGRRKLFDANSTIPRLVGVLGPISVLALPLIRLTDIPEEIWKIAIVDLPVVDLISDNSDGELYAGEGGGISFVRTGESRRATTAIQPAGPTKGWTVYPNMSMVVDSEMNGGVVMAATACWVV